MSDYKEFIEKRSERITNTECIQVDKSELNPNLYEFQ